MVNINGRSRMSRRQLPQAKAFADTAMARADCGLPAESATREILVRDRSPATPPGAANAARWSAPLFRPTSGVLLASHDVETIRADRPEFFSALLSAAAVTVEGAPLPHWLGRVFIRHLIVHAVDPGFILIRLKLLAPMAHSSRPGDRIGASPHYNPPRLIAHQRSRSGDR